jgi:hypothetical protein
MSTDFNPVLSAAGQEAPPAAPLATVGLERMGARMAKRLALMRKRFGGHAIKPR